MDSLSAVEDSHVDLLHEIGVRLAEADGFREVLTRVVEFASAIVKCEQRPKWPALEAVNPPGCSDGTATRRLLVVTWLISLIAFNLLVGTCAARLCARPSVPAKPSLTASLTRA